MDTEQSVGPEAYWRAALEDGHFLIQRDPASGTAYFPPRIAGSEGQTLEWVEASGRGTIYSLTTIHPRPPREPYNVALVDLAEGARMMSRIEGHGFAIGDAVQAAIAEDDDGPLVVFHPA